MGRPRGGQSETFYFAENQALPRDPWRDKESLKPMKPRGRPPVHTFQTVNTKQGVVSSPTEVGVVTPRRLIKCKFDVSDWVVHDESPRPSRYIYFTKKFNFNIVINTNTNTKIK